MARVQGLNQCAEDTGTGTPDMLLMALRAAGVTMGFFRQIFPLCQSVFKRILTRITKG